MRAPTSSGGTTFGVGSNGQILKSNGTSIYWAADSDSHYTTHMYVNATAGGATSNANTANTTTYLHLYDNTTKRETIQIKGSGTTSVSSTGGVITINSADSKTGTVTSVQVQATSPITSSTSTAQTGSLNTTIALADNYGDTKNPYASKTKNYVLAAGATADSVPSFRALVAADIPSLSTDKLTSGTLGVARGGTGQTSIANIQAGKDGDGNTISSTYLKLSGGTLTGNLTLSATSGNSPALIFNRDGSLTDWKIFVSSGKLSFQSAADNSTYTERGYFKDNSGTFVATTFEGNLTGNVTGHLTGNANSPTVGKDCWVQYPNGGTYATSTSSITGALKILLPQVSKNTIMSFNVHIYTCEGTNQSSVVYHISGYEYSSSGWYNPVCRAYSEGIGNYTNLTVRYGAENSKAYVTIGEADTVWSYPQVAISDVHLGYSNYTYALWYSDWSISFVTTLPSSSTGNRTGVNTQSINITGNAATATVASSANAVAWANVSGKPLTLTAAATGFTIAGGTTSKTLTVSENTTLKGGTSTYLAYYSANNTISGHSYAHFSDTYSSSTKNGKNELVLGNSTASTSNGSAYGQLALYSSGTKGTYLATAANSTEWYTATLPAASGTIAYTTSSITGNAATATRINGNLSAINDSVNHNIWVSSTESADGIPKYVSGVYVNSSGTITASGLTLNNPLSIANGGTGANNAAGARMNLFPTEMPSTAKYFITINDSWATGGYVSNSQAASIIRDNASGNWNISASTLQSTGYGTTCLSYYQTSGDFDGNTGWCHYIICNHGAGDSYYHYTLGLPFSEVPKYRRQNGSTSAVTPWYNFITRENLLVKTLETATNANGYINLGIDSTQYAVLAVKLASNIDGSNYYVQPYAVRGTDGWGAYVRNASTLQAVNLGSDNKTYKILYLYLGANEF